MKPIYSILLLLVCSSFAGTINYPVAKLYAYRQKVSGGANTTYDKKTKQTDRNYVYLLIKQNRTIQVEHVWIDGISVHFTTQEVNSPVTIDAGVSLSGKTATQQLVPATTHTVLQILTDNSNIEDSKVIPAKYKRYNVLIQYREGSSVFFLGTHNPKTVAAKANQ